MTTTATMDPPGGTGTPRKIPALRPPDRDRTNAAPRRRRHAQRHRRGRGQSVGGGSGGSSSMQGRGQGGRERRRVEQEQEQEGLVRGSYAPAKKTLGLELVADPKLLAKNASWDGGDAGPVEGRGPPPPPPRAAPAEPPPLADPPAPQRPAASRPERAAPAKKGGIRPRRSYAQLDSSREEEEAEEEAEEEEEDGSLAGGGASSRAAAAASPTETTPSLSSGKRPAASRIRRLGAPSRDSPSKKSAAGGNNPSGDDTSDGKAASRSSSSSSAPEGRSARWARLRGQASARRWRREEEEKAEEDLEESKEEEEHEEEVRRQQRQKRWEHRRTPYDDLDEPFDEAASASKEDSSASNAFSAILAVTPDRSAAPPSKETREYLKSKGLESVKRSRGGRVRSFFHLRSRSAANAKGGGNASAAMASDDDDEDDDKEKESEEARGGDDEVDREDPKSGTATEAKPPSSSSRSAAHGMTGRVASLGALAVIRMRSPRNSGATKVQEDRDGEGGDAPFDEGEDRPDGAAGRDVSRDASDGGAIPSPRSTSSLRARRRAPPISVDARVRSAERGPHLSPASASAERDDDDDVASATSSSRISYALRTREALASPAAVRDRRATKTVAQLSSRSQTEARLRQERRETRRARKEWRTQQEEVLRTAMGIGRSASGEEGAGAGGNGVDPSAGGVESDKRVSFGEGGRVASTSPGPAARSVTPSPTVPDPTMRDYFCTPTVSSSVIHDACPPVAALAADRRLIMAGGGGDSGGAGGGAGGTGGAPSSPASDPLHRRAPSNESPTGVEEVSSIQRRGGKKGTASEAATTGGGGDVVPPSPGGTDTVGSEDTEKTCNTTHNNERAEKILRDVDAEVEAREEVDRKGEGASDGDKVDASFAEDPTKKAAAEEASKKGTCIPLGGIACDNFGWFVNCWGTEKEQEVEVEAAVVVAEEEGSKESLAKKKRKWKEAKRAAEEAAIAASLAPSSSADDDAKATKAIVAEEKPVGEPERGEPADANDVAEAMGDGSATPPRWPHPDPPRPLFNATWDGKPSGTSPGAASPKRSGNVFATKIFKTSSADGSECSGRGSQASAKVAKTLKAVAHKIAKTASWDGSEKSEGSELSIVVREPEAGTAGTGNGNASTVELELDGDLRRLKVVPLSGWESERRREDVVPVAASSPGSGDVERDRSYSSLSMEARELLRSLSGDNASELADDQRRRVAEPLPEDEGETRPPEMRREMSSSVEFFDEGDEKGARKAKDRWRKPKGFAKEGGGRATAVVSEVREVQQQDDDISLQDDVDSIDGLSSIEDDDSLTVDSTLEHAVGGSSTVTSGATKKSNNASTLSEESAGCNAVPGLDMSTLAAIPETMTRIPMWKEGFNGVLDVIDKIDDAINGRVDDDSQSDSDESELSELYRKSGSRSRRRTTKYSRTRSGRMKEQRLRRRRQIEKARKHRRARSRSPASDDDQDPARRYQVRFSPGTIVDEVDGDEDERSDGRSTPAGDSRSTGERSTPADGRSTPASDGRSYGRSSTASVSEGRSASDLEGSTTPNTFDDDYEEDDPAREVEDDDPSDAIHEASGVDEDSFDNVQTLDGHSPKKRDAPPSLGKPPPSNSAVQERVKRIESHMSGEGSVGGTKKMNRISRSFQIKRGRSGKSMKSGTDGSAKSSPWF